MTTAAEVAQFMADELASVEYLYQEVVAQQIVQKFGGGFTHYNANGNIAINPDVLKAFNKLTPDAVWVRTERMWRGREHYDKPGRQQ